MQYNIRSEIAKIIAEEIKALEGDSHTFSTVEVAGLLKGSMFTGSSVVLECFVHNILDQSENQGWDLTQDQILVILDTFQEQTRPVLEAMEEEMEDMSSE